MQISAETLTKVLNWPDLIEALRVQFQKGCVAPPRHHHTMEVPGQADATMLLMPAWQPGQRIGVKLVNVFPDNTSSGLPSISANYFLYDGQTGQALATLDGAILTARRTAAAAALGADYLSRQDAKTLFVVGTGQVASLLAQAIGTIRPIKNVLVWGRSLDKAKAVCAKFQASGFDARPELDLQAGTQAADIISCATLSRTALIKGAWLKPGQHLDLIGSFTPEMRETDNDAMGLARVFIDTETALVESGDLVMPIKAGVLHPSSIQGTLSSLCQGQTKGRGSDAEITLFKGVGTALEDLAAASLAYETAVNLTSPSNPH